MCSRGERVVISVDEVSVQKQSADDKNTLDVRGFIEVDSEDHDKLSYIDASIEPLATQLSGDMFDVGVSYDFASRDVIFALKRMWEAGGWIVGVFDRGDSAQVVFVRPRGGSSSNTLTSSLVVRSEKNPDPRSESTERVVNVCSPKTSNPLLVRMPTRGRPEQALSVLAQYRSRAAEHVKIEVVIDEDDSSMNNTQVLQRLCELDCVVSIERNRSKIEAVNGGRVDDWAVLVLASDDMVPIVDGYDQRILDAMCRHFPLLDGAVYFDDGYNRDHALPGKPVLCTLPIMGRHLYEQFGYVYYPGYGSLYSDNEQTELLSSMRRIAFVDECIIEHKHHAAGKAAFDELYKFNDDKFGNADKRLFEERSKMQRPGSQFSFDAPPMLLSILICSTRARSGYLNRLLEHLRAQVGRFQRQVELCVAVDDGEQTIGEKRQALLERAVGHYVAFVDDDDWVSHDYVELVRSAVRSCEVDCASLRGIMTTNGERPEYFHHSLDYDSWFTDKTTGLHCRTPNHLNAVRRELALKAGFPSKSFGEDHSYSKALYPLLKTEAKIDSLLYYYWFRSRK